jgi:hypothetical protein
MLNDFKNLALTIVFIYAVAYGIGFIVALIKHRREVKDELVKLNKKTMALDRALILMFLVLLCVATSGCSTAKHVPTWRDAYLNRKPVIVAHGVPFYPEHLEYLNRNVEYMCLAGIKPMLPPEFSNKQAIDFCGCMSDEYYTKQEMMAILLKLDYNPNNVVLVFKQIQNEYWAVMDDEFKSNYREIVKYPPGYYEKITASRAKCIDDVNYKEYTKQVVNRE